MSEAAQAHVHEPEFHHPGAAVYVTVAVILAVLTAMEVTVFYISAMRPVMVPLLLILSAAKFALVVMFYMHLKYDSWLLSSVLIFPLMIAAFLLFALMFLFAYLSHHAILPPF
jgi:cytochrome c oxidase subunit IV